MRFPKAERVIYGANPLAQVICQIRFFPLLAIGSQLPVEFQTRLRQAYPKLSISQGLAVQIGGSTPTSVPADHSYTFATADDSSRVELAKDSLTLTTTAYK